MGNIEDLIGKKVRDRRLRLGLSQSDLAKNAKTSLTTINRLEKGRQLPQSSTLKEIARALGVTDAAIAFWETGKRFPRGKNLRNLSIALGVSESQILEGEQQKTSPSNSDRASLILEIQDMIRGLSQDDLETLKFTASSLLAQKSMPKRSEKT